MRFFTTVLVAFGLSSAALALPVDGTVESRSTSTLVPKVVSSAVPIASTYATNLQKIVNYIVNDPLLALSPCSTNACSKSDQYNIPAHLEAALAKAEAGILSLPSLPSSSNPTSQVIADYAPLVTVVARTLEAVLIDSKLLSIKILDPALPGYGYMITQFDNNVHQYVADWDSVFKGFSNALADKIGANTPLGEAIKTLGGSAFGIIFDHQGTP